MEIAYTEEQEALRDELRAYYDKLLTPEVEDDLAQGRGVGPVVARSSSRWQPTAGSASAGRRSGAARAARRSSSSSSSTSRCAPARRCRCSRSTRSRRRSCGSAREEQKEFYLPKILTGEIHFAIGYTEPDAGTDLASLTTTRGARRRRVRHQRPEGLHEPRRATPTTSGSRCAPTQRGQEAQGHLDHHRAHRHARLPRTCRSTTSGDLNTNITYYEDVRVPVGNLVGEENQGWSLITNQLNHERVTLCSLGRRRAHARRRARLGAGDEARRRPPRHRPGVGAGQPRPRARQARVPAPRQLAGRVARAAAAHARTRPTRRRSRCTAPSSTWRPSRLLMEVMRPGRLPARRLARRGARAAGSRRTLRSHAHPHLRRRHQRDAARPDRDLRAQHARSPR